MNEYIKVALEVIGIVLSLVELFLYFRDRVKRNRKK